MASGAGEWTSQCSGADEWKTHSCVAMGVTAVLGIPYGISIAGIAIMFFIAGAQNDIIFSLTMCRLSVLFGIILMTMAISSCTLGIAAIAAWCRGCENDKRGSGWGFSVGGPVSARRYW